MAQASPLQLGQKMTGIVCRVSVPEPVQVEQYESLASPQELPCRQIPMYRGGFRRIKECQRPFEGGHQRFDDP